MHVSRCGDRFTKLLAKIHNSTVDIPQRLIIRNDLFPHHKRIVSEGLDLQKVIPFRDAPDLCFVCAMYDRLIQFALLAGRAND